MKDVIIVIPLKDNGMTELEKISFRQAHEIFKERDIALLASNDMDIESNMLYKNDIIIRFNSKYFGSPDAHNNLLLSAEFYQRFIEYNFILIYHLDAFVFYDALDIFCNMPYDYFASPRSFHKQQLYGKCICDGLYGGFALRRVQAFLAVQNEARKLANSWQVQEDIIYSWISRELGLLRSIPLNIALTFSFDTNVRKLYKMNRYQLPMGAHRWWYWRSDFEFYKPFIEQYGHRLSDSSDYPSIDIDYRKMNAQEYVFYRLLRNSDKIDNIKKAFFKRYCRYNHFAIWGAGKDGQRFLSSIRKICDIYMFIDKDSNKWGKYIDGVKVNCLDFQKIRIEHVFIFVATKIHSNEITDYLASNDFVKDYDYIDVSDFQEWLIHMYYKGCG